MRRSFFNYLVRSGVAAKPLFGPTFSQISARGWRCLSHVSIGDSAKASNSEVLSEATNPPFSSVSIGDSAKTSNSEALSAATNPLLSSILKGQANSGDLKAAFETIAQLDSEGVVPSLATINALLKSCVRQQEIGALFKMRRLVDQYGYNSDPMIGNTLVKAFSKFGKLEVATEILRSMQNANVSIKIETYNNVLLSSSRSLDLKRTLEVFSSMFHGSGDVRPNTESLKWTIDACARHGQWPIALSLFQTHKELATPPNYMIYSNLIVAYSKGGQIGKAEDLLTEMLSSGVETKVWNYNSILEACQAQGDWQKALEILERAEADGGKLDDYSFLLVLRTCNNAGVHEVAQELFLSMENRGVKSSSACRAAAREAEKALLQKDKKAMERHEE